MESKSDVKKLIILFIGVVYGISAISDFIWINSKNVLHPAAILTIIAPTVGAVVVFYKSRKKVKVHLSKCLIKEILFCTCIPIIYFSLSFIAYSLFTGNIKPFDLSLGDIFRMIILYIFMGILEEVGWRGVLLPLMQRVYSFNKAIILNGLVWAFWHYPMIISGLILPYANSILGILSFTLEVILMTCVIANLQKNFSMVSLWPIIFLHACHNIMSDVMISSVGDYGAIFIGDGGYLLVLIIAILTIISINKRNYIR